MMVQKLFKYAFSSQNELTKEDFSSLEALNPGLTTAHPKRQASFLAARKALQKLVPHMKLTELKLNEFHFLEDFPQHVFSLAHTKDLAVAAMVGKNDYRSIGVDIEFLDRIVKENSERHFINSEDDRSINDLELWCAKEAAFKASSFLFDKNFVLKDLWIRNSNFGHIKNCALDLGQIKTFVAQQTLVTIALLKK